MGYRRSHRAFTTALAGIATLALVFGVLPGVLMATAAPAAAAADPDGVSFTLEGCRNNGGITLPNPGGKFVCPDSAYTTGNLGKGWNELDLVPFRITTDAGNSAPATQTYAVAIALDNFDAGHPGYDVLSSDAGGAPVLNTSLSDASCTALTSSPQQTKTPGVGGIDQTIYRTLTITQQANTTCVYDWYGRLALGSHLFPGSSLHANLLNQNLGTSGIGSKDVSIPVKEISPQELRKDMSASQAQDNVWNISKSPTPAHLNFENTCAPGGGSLQQPVSITVTWKKVSALGGITVLTHVYATNPAARTITTNVTDVIYDVNNNQLDTASASKDVPANTTQLVLTTTTSVPAGTPVPLHDIATGTYTDTVTGVPIPGTTTATASATPTITTTNGTAVITDSEGITGTGLTFSVDSTSGASGNFTGYTPGTHTTGPVSWTSDIQSGDGSVTFNKTVYVDQPRQTTGSLKDTATVTGSDGFTASATGTVDITTSAQVSLAINKTIPDVLQGTQTQTFGFQVQDGSNTVVASPSVSFAAGDTSQSTTVSALQPGSYTVSENPAAGWDAQSPQPVSINLPSCSGSVTFHNTVPPAHAKAVKVTNPDGFTSGWDMTLKGPGTGSGGETVTTGANGTASFTTDLQEGNYTITEAPQAGWNQTDQSGCSFTVDYPADGGKVFTCTITNTYQPDISLTKAGPGLSKVGDPADYTITLKNTSPAPGAAGAPKLNCTVTDDEIGFSKTVTGLAVGESDVSNPTFTIPTGASDPFLNTAHATCTVPGSSPAITASADSNTVSTNLFQPSVAITKTGPAYSAAGDTVTYTVTITNTSSLDSPNLVLDSFSDSLVAGVTPPDACKDLAPGDHCSFTYTYTVQSGDPDPLVNTATVHYHPSGFPNDISDSATWTTNLLHPGFTVSKTCTTQPVPQAGPAKFDVTFTNTGDADLVITADDNLGTFNLAAGATKTFTVTVNGPFAGQATVDNKVTATAALDPKYGLSDTIGPKSDSASCDVMGLAKVIKTVSGQQPSGTQSFTFTLREGASVTDLGTILQTQAANAGNGGVLNFTTDLVPGNHYQMCEDVMPGWNTSLGPPLFVPGSMTTPTLPNPNVNNMTVCTDFVAQAGQTTTFTVDNTPPPGGRALTIGFWKNWASCTASSTNKKPVLDQTLATATSLTSNPPGGLVVSAQNAGGGWPNFAAAYYLVLKGSAGTPNSAPDCAKAVNLLNKTTIDGKTKKASDPLFNMAAQLVGAQLNYFAGAGKNGPTTINIQSAVLLLGKYGFNGNTYSPKLSSADTAQANCLATQLDNYNNDRSVSTC
jgi:uncharacterized repeat protein (TIGR01451 family)